MKRGGEGRKLIALDCATCGGTIKTGHFAGNIT
jgi:hypothetical protein